MRHWPGTPWGTLALAAAALAVAAVPDATAWLALDRGAVLDGELWRLLTGHFVHGTAYHLRWNLLGLLGVGILWEGAVGRRWWSLCAASCATVSVGVLLLTPELRVYHGLSGMLNGLWLGGALVAARQELDQGRRSLAAVYYAFVAADLAKIGVEAWRGAPFFTDSAQLGGAAVPLAHALGALGGAIWFRYARRLPEDRRRPVAGISLKLTRCPSRSSTTSA